MSKAGLSGQIAVVTGASSGLGQATAGRLAALGAGVALLARSQKDLDRNVEQIRTDGGHAIAVVTDLADFESINAAVQRVLSELGPMRILVNAAATDVPATAEELDPRDFEKVLRVNLTAPFLLSKLVLPHMRRIGAGTIINVSSVAGRRGWANASAYCASKFGLTGLTQALAAEASQHSIRVLSLYPGAMATQWGTFGPAARGSRPETRPEDALPPEDVAEYIAWLVMAPDHLAVTESVVVPLREKGWP